MDKSRFSLPLLIAAIFTLLAAVWAGWIRVGWQWPVIQPALPVSHGPLMISGFLGTLISVERVVALRKRWLYIAPAFSAIGGLLLALGVRGVFSSLLFTLSSVGLLVIFVIIIRQHPALYTYAMGGGALLWLVGNAFWLFGQPIYQSVFWWAGFLILTIAAERLELGRLARLSRSVELAFVGSLGLIVAGLTLRTFVLDWGTRLAGLGMLTLAIWLLRFDLARRTVRQSGLPRYIAICLLSGYGWLVIAGVLGLWVGGVTTGFRYDALMHTIFLGFVFSMIFGHAPIIFPAILGVKIAFHPLLYAQLALLHLSLLLRVGGDLFNSAAIRKWGGLFNGVALLLFLAGIAITILRSRRTTNG